jgi:hypothetical protein
MKVISQQSKASIPYQEDLVSVAARNAWCEVQTIGVSNNPVGSEGNTMTAYAAAELTIRSQHVTTYTVSPLPADSGVEVPAPWQDFDLCDTVRFHVNRGRFVVSNQTIRIFGWTADIDDASGTERLSSLNLAP